RLAKGHLLPPGAAPETQVIQSLLWQAVVFWAALFYHLPLLQELEGELEDGHGWQPGLWTPDRRFRFRFTQPDFPVPLKALLAARLLPEDAVSWLFLVPEAWRCLTLHLGGQPASVPLIDTLLQEAAGQVQSPLLKLAETSEISDAAEEELSESGRVSPPSPLEAAPATEPSDDSDTDTLALLSLFQSGQGSSHQHVAKNDHHGSKLTERPVPEEETVATHSHLKTLL
ncbi:TraI domain-containing protein, partial [Xenorhabdus sp. PR6a]